MWCHLLTESHQNCDQRAWIPGENSKVLYPHFKHKNPKNRRSAVGWVDRATVAAQNLWGQDYHFYSQDRFVFPRMLCKCNAIPIVTPAK